MTDWTAEEERVARAMAERNNDYCERGLLQWPAYADDARAAIAAMSGWRDVKTDPPPCDDTFALAYWRDGNMSVEDFDHDSDPEWWAKRGLTHWMPLPPAPEDKP